MPNDPRISYQKTSYTERSSASATTAGRASSGWLVFMKPPSSKLPPASWLLLQLLSDDPDEWKVLLGSVGILEGA